MSNLLEFTASPLLVPSLFVFGLMVGSFLNVCIARLPAGESIVRPGSRCPNCRTAIRWYDNIPVLSYVILSGRCRACGTSISPRYVIVEIVTGLAFAWQAWAVGDDPMLLGSRVVFTALLIALFGTDLETQRLPNALTIPGLVLGVAGSLQLPPGLRDSLLGVALGAGVLLAIRWLWERLRGVEAMGLGDVKMLAMVGAFLGWRQVFVVLFLATCTGAIIGVLLARRSGSRPTPDRPGRPPAPQHALQMRLPFGTFLAVAAFVASLYGEPLLEWYMGLYRF